MWVCQTPFLLRKGWDPDSVDWGMDNAVLVLSFCRAEHHIPAGVRRNPLGCLNKHPHPPGSVSQSAFPWENPCCVLTVAHECVHRYPPPAPSACPSLPPFVTHIPWLFLGKAKEIATTCNDCPRICIFIPKGFGISFCLRQKLFLLNANVWGWVF